MRNPFDVLKSLALPAVTGILQVGASSGQEVPLFHAHGVRFATLLEPLEGPFTVLKSRCANHPDYLVAQALCGPEDNQLAEFHVASNNGESSSLLRPARHLRDHPWVAFPQVLRLKTVRLDSIFALVRTHRPDIAAATNMLYMDVQGAELQVLMGGTGVLESVSYLYTEVGVGGSYEGDVELVELLNFVRPYGFKLHDLESDRWGGGNALLVKRRDPGTRPIEQGARRSDAAPAVGG